MPLPDQKIGVIGETSVHWDGLRAGWRTWGKEGRWPEAELLQVDGM